MSVQTYIDTWTKVTTVSTNKRKRVFGNFDVELSASAQPNVIRVNSIRSNNRKSGKLGELFQWLTESADKNKVILTLCAQPFGWDKDNLPDKDKLQEVTERFGFVTAFKYPDDEGYEMVRKVGRARS